MADHDNIAWVVRVWNGLITCSCGFNNSRFRICYHILGVAWYLSGQCVVAAWRADAKLPSAAAIPTKSPKALLVQFVNDAVKVALQQCFLKRKDFPFLVNEQVQPRAFGTLAHAAAVDACRRRSHSTALHASVPSTRDELPARTTAIVADDAIEYEYGDADDHFDPADLAGSHFAAPSRRPAYGDMRKAAAGAASALAKPIAELKVLYSSLEAAKLEMTSIRHLNGRDASDPTAATMRPSVVSAANILQLLEFVHPTERRKIKTEIRTLLFNIRITRLFVLRSTACCVCQCSYRFVVSTCVPLLVTVHQLQVDLQLDGSGLRDATGDGGPRARAAGAHAPVRYHNWDTALPVRLGPAVPISRRSSKSTPSVSLARTGADKQRKLPGLSSVKYNNSGRAATTGSARSESSESSDDDLISERSYKDILRSPFAQLTMDVRTAIACLYAFVCMCQCVRTRAVLLR